MPSILVTNFQDSGEDVMVFTDTVTADQIKSRFEQVSATFDECYEVPEEDRQFHCYEPCWLTPQNEADIIKHHPA